MKILMVIDSLDKGGKERRMLELIKGLKNTDASFDIYLISLTDRIEYKYVYELPIQFKILKRRYRKDLTITFKLKRIISAFKPDIIHSWSTMASVYLSFANLWRKRPLINAVLADAPAHLNMLNKHFFRVKLTTPFTDMFVSNSHAGIRSYKTPKSKSVCIYNGIDFRRFEKLRPANEMRMELFGKEQTDSFVVAMVASFDERKDFETLVNVAVGMCKTNAKLIFILIGNGPTMEFLQAKVPHDILNHQIIFTGKRNDVESVLQIVDLGVLMTNAKTHGEGVSNSIIEYMASGKPVVATRGGGTDEVVRDDLNGYLIDPGNGDQLINGINRLILDRNLLRLLGENAGRYVRDNFDLGKKTAEYVRLYRDLNKNK